MAGGIFLIQDNGDLAELAESPYEAEEVLQRLLADYPNILAGDQFDPVVPRQWLLVSREISVPSEEGGSGRWSLDHLLLDQDGIPTLVEVKRSSDTRIRREVVGQLLDYAANAVVYWPAESIRSHFEATCALDGKSPEIVIADKLGPEIDPEHFWQLVNQNLLAERIRLVFVADVIPPELQRIVEFLNGQMTPAQVIAVEVRQYIGQSVRALVPRVLGQTVAAQEKKNPASSRVKREWDESSFLSLLAELRGTQEVGVAQAILQWARESGLRISWGNGAKVGLFFPEVESDRIISVGTNGYVEVLFGNLVSRSRQVSNHPFASDERRLDLLRRFNVVPGINLDESKIAKYPSFKLIVLEDRDARRTFLQALDWFVSQVQARATA